MKNEGLSTAERDFICAALKTNSRIDGRNLQEFRKIKISFGSDYGTAEVMLGLTRYYSVTLVSLSQY